MKITKRNFLLISTIIFFRLNCTSSETKWELMSPDKSLIIKIEMLNDGNVSGQIKYSVFRVDSGNRLELIRKSPLGLIRSDQSFVDNLSFVSKSNSQLRDRIIKMKIGRQQLIHDYANEVKLTFENMTHSQIQLVLRAYNDGVAFRYVFPEKSDETKTINKELTGFNIPVEGKAWIQPYDRAWTYAPAYERYYENEITIGSSAPSHEGWAFPALFNVKNSWLLITESDLTDKYCGVRFEQNATNGLYKIRFPEAKDGEGIGGVCPVSTLPWILPWRVIIIGKKAESIVESHLVNILALPQIKGNFNWVNPGKSSWSWLSDNPSPKNYDALKSFVDLSAQMHWEYSLVDANWDLMEGGNIEQLVKYANSKGVGIFMWYNSGGANNVVTERPRNIMSNPKKRIEEFRKLHEWGVKGVKVDFWHSDKQLMIKQYIDLLRDAAKYKIMVNFHGCTIPRGWSRTYPNLISMESVRGEECYLFDSLYTTQAPIQNSILAFTRNVIGPMDYTPLGLSNFKIKHSTTYAHELALTLIFNSGIVHFADNVKMYQSIPYYVKNFLSELPVVFDEVKCIEGYPGKDVVIAQRKGNEWYIAGINSEKTAKTYKLNLPFIQKTNNKVSIITDGSSAYSFQNTESIPVVNQSFEVSVSPLGGFVAKIISK